MRFYDFFIKKNKVQLKHLNHPEENIFSSESFNQTYEILSNLNHFIKSGKRKNNLDITVKVDGAPSIIFGYHPITGNFFVATKSAFNKTPKINYTIEDINKNHGHSAGLCNKLELALKYLPNVIKNNTGVYQGDLLFGNDDKIEIGDVIQFKSNTITYGVECSHKDYQLIEDAQIGIAVHTIYTGVPINQYTLEGMYVDFNKDNMNLDRKNSNIYLMDLQYISSDTTYPMDYNNISHHLKFANKLYKSFKRSEYDIIKSHSKYLKIFINYNIRNNYQHYTIDQYYSFIENRFNKEINKLKRIDSKKHKTMEKELFLIDIINNESILDKLLIIHEHIRHAKEYIINSLNIINNDEFIHLINDKLTNPEGYVVSKNGNSIKLVSRYEFSRLNFENFN